MMTVSWVRRHGSAAQIRHVGFAATFNRPRRMRIRAREEMGTSGDDEDQIEVRKI